MKLTEYETRFSVSNFFSKFISLYSMYTVYILYGVAISIVRNII